MKKLFILFFLSAYCLNAQHNEIQLDLGKTNDLDISSSEGVYDIVATGKDPYVFSLPLKRQINPENSQLAFEYFCPSGVDFIEVMFYSGEEFRASKMLLDIGSTEGFVEFKMEISEELKKWGGKGDVIRFDFGAAPALKLQVKNVKFRLLTSREKEILAQKRKKSKRKNP